MNTRIKDHPTRKNLIQTKDIKEEIDVPSVMIQSTEKALSVLQGSSSIRPVINMVILQACATKSNHLLGQETPRHISFKQEWSTPKKIPYLASQVI